MHAPQSELTATAADLLARLRERRPRVHCITNTVAQALTANVLLAVGAIPSMTTDAAEVAEFVATADALLVNLGTLDAERRHASEAAIATAKSGGKPWVLDPVFIDRTARRATFARSLAARGPRAIRCNAAEFEALSGTPPSRQAQADYAAENSVVVGLTGAVDQVTDGRRHASIVNGDPMMSRITALGCAGSALVAAALAIEDDAFVATVAALLWLGVAGEAAAAKADGPGSLAIELLDALYGLDSETLTMRARMT